MVSDIPITIRPAADKDRKQLASLIHFETFVHRHLDWRAPLDWVGFSPCLVAEQSGSLVATLISPPDPPDIAWIRLFAVSSDFDKREAWERLWPEAKARISGERGITIAAIPLQYWFQELLETSGFMHANNVIMLLWERGCAIPDSEQALVVPRPMNYDDLQAVVKVDTTAFGALWRNSLDSLELAFQQAAVATVAEQEGKVVGYQISTASPMGGHLARLAVAPAYQGKGIGYALVRDTLYQFNRRGAMRVTVNTQQDNLASLALYKKAGFHETKEKYPVFWFKANKSV
jgi:[ribosomal protein S18]-alanine N-acetyltransferase